MTFKLIKTSTFVHACTLIQVDDTGKQHTAKLKVRFNAITRAKWDEMTKNGDPDDDRLLFDVLVNKVEDPIEGADAQPLSVDEAIQAIREDLSLTGQVVDQGMEVLFGAAAKNARRSRAR